MSFISIGLEIHVTLKTEYKAFSKEKSTGVSWVTLGFPGTLPTINMDALSHTIRLAQAFNCTVDPCNIFFDRKNYFYHDLPRGYQITQYFHPTGKSGYLKLSSGKTIRIKQIHMEEDTAQQTKTDSEIRLNFSRLGQALAEIVTEPDFESYEEVEEFLRTFRRICTFNGISNAAYENGEIRVDLNLSVRKNLEDPLNTKSEVKNLNSLLAIKKSIDFLVKTKEQFPDEESFTYCWSEKSQTCEVMRKKGDASSYFYIPEANIPVVRVCNLSVDLITDFDGLAQKLREQGLKEPEVQYLLENHQIFELVFKLNKQLNNLPSSYNWMVNIVSGIMESTNWEKLPYEEIEKVVLETEITKKINLKIAKSILKEILINGFTFKDAYKKLNISLVSDKATVAKFMEEAFEQYKDQIPSLIGNLFKLEKLIIGTCMKKSRGQADPIVAKSLFDEMVKKFTKDQ